MFDNYKLIPEARQNNWLYHSIFAMYQDQFNPLSENILVELSDISLPFHGFETELQRLKTLHKNFNVRFIVSNIYEYRGPELDLLLTELTTYLDIPTEHLVYFVNSSVKDDPNVIINYPNTQYIDYFTLFTHQQVTAQYKLTDIKRGNGNENGLFLIGKPHKIQRIRTLARLYQENLLDDFKWSLYIHNDHVKRQCYNYVQDLFTYPEYEQFLSETVKTLDDVDIEFQPTSSHCTGFPYDINLFNSTKFSIVSESDYDLSDVPTTLNNIMSLEIPWITEKTYKAIIHKHPFIFLGTNQALQRLKDIGYRTFNDPITGSPEERIEHGLHNIRTMSTTDSAVFAEDVEHNYNLYQDIVQRNKIELQNIIRNLFDS